MTDEEYLHESRTQDADCPSSIAHLDPDPEENWSYLCTRPIGHSGLHIGCGREVVRCRWSTDYQPLPNLMLP